MNRFLLCLVLLLLGGCAVQQPASDVDPSVSRQQALRIARGVSEAIQGDKGLSKFDINVNVIGGIVTLSGQVKDQVHADRLLSLAKSTPGVRGVKNRLSFFSPLDDQALKDRIFTALSSESDISTKGMRLRVAERVVYLDNSSVSSRQRDQILSYILGISGVRDVRVE